MVNKEMAERLKIAGEYQRKAICALFPEGMDEHLDVIERELKSMFFEMIAGQWNKNNENDSCKKAQEKETQSNVKKVDIV